jgi:hypothetical protein
VRRCFSKASCRRQVVTCAAHVFVSVSGSWRKAEEAPVGPVRIPIGTIALMHLELCSVCVLPLIACSHARFFINAAPHSMNSLSARPLQHRYGEANRELVGVIVSVNLDRQRLTLIDGTSPAQRLRHLPSSPSCVQREGHTACILFVCSPLRTRIRIRTHWNVWHARHGCGVASRAVMSQRVVVVCISIARRLTVVVWHLEQ